MNQQQRAVVQQALEALKGLYAITEIAQEDIDCRFAWAEMPDAKEAITALRKLLEQPADWLDLSVEQKMRIHYECEDSISYAIELTLDKLREKNGYGS